jgi:hypothetical protein
VTTPFAPGSCQRAAKSDDGIGDYTALGVLERDTVTAAVRRLLGRTRAGAGSALFVVGEAGLGKTTVLNHAEARGAGLPCRFPRIAAATGLGLLAEHAGDNESADASHRAALALHESVDLPVERVETLLAYGAFLRRAGRPSIARPLLAEAVAVAERIGAVWLAGYAAEELIVAGGRPRHRRAADDLTAQARRVAQLATEGAAIGRSPPG